MSIRQEFHTIFDLVHPVRSFEEVAKQIQNAISSGQIKVGDRLPNERELAGIFQVSRATLREAIRLLEGAGIVHVMRGVNGGTFVNEPKDIYLTQALDSLIRFKGATVEDLAEFRSSFEGESAFWASKRRTKEQVSELYDIVSLYKKSITDKTWAELVTIDVLFHRLIAKCSNNSIREAIMSGIYDVFNTASLRLNKMADYEFRQKQYEDLYSIADAISEAEPERARTLMIKHVERNSDLELMKSNIL